MFIIPFKKEKKGGQITVAAEKLSLIFIKNSYMFC